MWYSKISNTRNVGFLEKTIERIVKGITYGHNATCKLTTYGYPPLVTDKKATEIVKRALENLLGKEKVVESKPILGGEDFAYYLQKVLGTYLILGVCNEKLGYIYNIHTTKFNINERILPYGSSILAYSALELLKN